MTENRVAVTSIVAFLGGEHEAWTGMLPAAGGSVPGSRELLAMLMVPVSADVRTLVPTSDLGGRKASTKTSRRVNTVHCAVCQDKGEGGTKLIP